MKIREIKRLTADFTETFATVPNIWQGVKLRLSSEDLQIFQEYYERFRKSEDLILY